jgi:transposase InsO family protein
LNQTPRKTTVQQNKIVSEIKRIHSLPKLDNYGSPRMHKELNKVGVQCCENSVAKLMRKEGIRAITVRKFRVTTTDSKHDLPIAPNRLDQDFKAQGTNQVWLTDFTYIALKEGFTYLCTVQDLYSRRIVGWATSFKIDAALALDALDQAIALRQPKSGLIVHSDRGSQFASNVYRDRLNKRHFLQSMSRKGNCYDNAPMESFFKSFKTEEVYQNNYQTHEEASRAAANYIERFYNRIRLHSALGYRSPMDFERLESTETKRTI